MSTPPTIRTPFWNVINDEPSSARDRPEEREHGRETRDEHERRGHGARRVVRVAHLADDDAEIGRDERDDARREERRDPRTEQRDDLRQHARLAEGEVVGLEPGTGRRDADEMVLGGRAREQPVHVGSMHGHDASARCGRGARSRRVPPAGTG